MLLDLRVKLLPFDFPDLERERERKLGKKVFFPDGTTGQNVISLNWCHTSRTRFNVNTNTHTHTHTHAYVYRISPGLLASV